MSYTDFDFPHTSLYQSDLREILAQMKKLEGIVNTFVTVEKVTFADPVLWNIATQYSKNTIVLSVSGDAYLSKQAVPTGVQLNNEDYWQEIFNFADYVRTANENLTINVEQNTTRSEHAYNVDDWLLWDDVLYKVIAEIAVDDLLIVDTNVEHFTVEDFIKAWIRYANGIIQQYKDDIDASEIAYRQQLAQDIATTTSSLQLQLNQAIAGVTVDSEVINARIAWDGAIYDTLGNAIRSQFNDIIGSMGEITDNILLESWGVGYITATGTIATSTPSIHNEAFTAISPSTNYFIRHPDSYNATQVCWYDSNYDFISRTAPVSDIATSPATAAYLRLSLYGYGTAYNYDMGVFAIGDDNEYIPHIIANDRKARAEIAANYTTLDNKIDTVNGNLVTYEKDMADFMFDANIENVDISTMTGVDSYIDFNCTASTGRLNLVAMAGYDSYAITMPEDCKLFAGDKSGLSYYSLATLTNPAGSWTPSGANYTQTGDASARYRLVDSNLPTYDTPLSINAGTLIVITVPSGESPYINIWKDTPKSTNKVINSDIISVEMYNDYFYYYIQGNDGNYLRFKFEHFIDADINSNVYVQRVVDLVEDDKRTVIKPIIREGEWDMAIMLQGRSDYIGGKNHGSEVTTQATMYFDGVPYSTLMQDVFDCKEIIIATIANMYDPNDESTIVAIHHKKYIITANEIVIKQNIEWLDDFMASESYSLMLPAVRGNDIYSAEQITDRFYDDKTLTLYDIATTTFDPYVIAKNNKGNCMTLYGVNSGIYMTAECDIVGKEVPFAYVTNSSYYNKIYMAYCGNNTPVNNGDIWQWSSKYQIRG